MEGCVLGMRMMVVFEKGLALRHIGHLDLMRSMQRALRRSGLPIVYSKGFNPHIELSFASPLGVGVAGLREMMDLPIAEDIAEEEFVRLLNTAVPPSLPVKRARLIPDNFPSLMSLTAASRYTLRFSGKEAGEVIAKKLAKKLPEWLALSEYTALRKTKSGEKLCDIRPFVQEAEAVFVGDDLEIRCILEATPLGTLKSSLFAKCLRDFAGIENAEDAPCAAIRQELLCRAHTGELVRMEDYQDVW